jgi:hypothetical protein
VLLSQLLLGSFAGPERVENRPALVKLASCDLQLCLKLVPPELGDHLPFGYALPLFDRHSDKQARYLKCKLRLLGRFNFPREDAYTRFTPGGYHHRFTGRGRMCRFLPRARRGKTSYEQ